MAGYQTGAQQLIQAGKEMEDTNQRLMSALKQLDSAVEAVAGSWAGAAHAAFAGLMAQFANDASTLNANLNKIAEAIAGTAANYTKQEEESSQSVSAIASALGG